MSVSLFPAAVKGGAGGAAIDLRRQFAVTRVGWVSMASPARRSAMRTRAAVKGVSFYEILGIPIGGSAEEIKRAYRQLARKYHPDVSPPDLEEEHARRFIDVHEAYVTLSDPERRTIYDRDLSHGLHLAISNRRRLDQGGNGRAEWQIRWQDQLEGLKRRRVNKNRSQENLSWGTKMRMQRDQPSTN